MVTVRGKGGGEMEGQWGRGYPNNFRFLWISCFLCQKAKICHEFNFLFLCSIRMKFFRSLRSTAIRFSDQRLGSLNHFFSPPKNQSVLFQVPLKTYVFGCLTKYSSVNFRRRETRQRSFERGTAVLQANRDIWTEIFELGKKL